MLHRVGGPLTFAAADVTVTGLGRVRHDAECHELAVLRQACGDFGRRLKDARIADHVVRRRHHQSGLRIDLEGPERRECDCRRGITAGRFEQNRRCLEPQSADLLGHREAVRFVAHHDGRLRAGYARQPGRRVLQHGVLARERQQLLGIHFSRQRPEPRAGAARQDHRNQ
ncbi:MAG: hypothetical protein NVS9B2_18050 [Steroidobacteraceae bacterium]